MMNSGNIVIKRIILVLLLLVAPKIASANVFDDAANFICGNSSVSETWNGRTKTYDETKLCPPYNKFGNRGGCLKQYDAPKLGTFFYFKYCAEEAPSSSYFSPKIQVRMQSCNALLLSCWAFSSELSWDGECVLWPSPTLFPLQRICARMAAPADNNATPATPKDEGYTYFKHLNFEGVLVDDKRIPGTDGQSTFIVSPKTCAYWDPWAFDLFPVMPLSYIPLFDIFDYNPVKQPFHHGSGVHPIVQMMISFIEAGLNSTEMVLKMINFLQQASLGPIGLLMGFIGDKTGLTKMIIDMVTKCIKLVGEEVFIRILKEFGQLNHVVYENLGCVNVPMGPFPPPYPPQYASAPPAPKVEPVCATTADYTITAESTSKNFVAPMPVISSAPAIPPSGATNITVTKINGVTTSKFDVKNSDNSVTTTTSVSPSFITSNSSKGCATSALSNNAINNVVRVGIDKLLPRCDLASLSNSDTTASPANPAVNSCVNIEGAALAGITSGTAGIKSCANGSAPCIKITTPPVEVPSACANSASPCGFRVVYATQYVAASPPLINPYYDPSLPDCTGGVYPCQLIWGVNAGPYNDIVLKFPDQENSYVGNTLINNNPTSSTTAFRYNNQDYKFMAAISRTAVAPLSTDQLSYYNSAANSYTSVSADKVGIQSQDPAKICVYTPTDPSVALAQGTNTASNWTLSTCLPRAATPSPIALACGTPGAPGCTSNNFAPRMVVALSVGGYTTQGVLAANSFAATKSGDSYVPAIILNLAGSEYSATVTDNTFITSPFPLIPNTTKHNPAWSCGNISNFASAFASFDYNSSFGYIPNANNGTLFGTHNPAPSTAPCPGAKIPFYIANTSSPTIIGNDKVIQTGAIYLSGLEYVNNQYLVGGNYMCLTTSTQNTCATNVNNCVLAKLLNNNFIDCATFNTKVLGKYPGIGLCSSSDTDCVSLSTVASAINSNIVSIYQCGTAPNITKCYSYNDPSKQTSGALCSPSLNPKDRVYPAYDINSNDPRLNANQYYDPDINSNKIQDTISDAQDSLPVVQDCNSYLNRVVDLSNPVNKPYIGIPRCAVTNPLTVGNAAPLCTGSTVVPVNAPNPFPNNMCYDSTIAAPVCSTSAPIIETFISTLTSTPLVTQRLDIRLCATSSLDPITGVATRQNNYCYDPSPVPDLNSSCQINSASVTRTSSSGNPATGSPTLDCGSFISLFGSSNSVSLLSSSPYDGITACPINPSGSVITTFTSSSSPALTVDLYQYVTTSLAPNSQPVLAAPAKQLNYCYNPRTSGSTCTLNRTNTTVSRPAQLDCYTLLTMINADYKDIVPCATPPAACASQAFLNAYAAQNYASNPQCISESPQCTNEATVSSAATGKNITVKKCSTNTKVTLAYSSGETADTNSIQNYYCYSYNGDSTNPLPSCSLNTSDFVVTPLTTPPPSSLSIQLSSLTIPDVITNINGAGSPAPSDSPIPPVLTGVRSKTSLEQGLCADVPALPQCAGITNATNTSGYATWDPANVGAQSTGYCMNGYMPISATSLYRYCLINPELAKPSFVPIPNLEPINASLGCKLAICPVNTTLAGNGNAIWSGSNTDKSTPVDSNATGECASGYIPPPGGLATRKCSISGYDTMLTSVDQTTTCTASPDWEIGFIYPNYPEDYPTNGVWSPQYANSGTGISVETLGGTSGGSGISGTVISADPTPKYYASNFRSNSLDSGNWLVRGQFTSGNKTSIFVPGPKLPDDVPQGATLTMYLNIKDINKIEKIAYIDTNCPWDAWQLCYGTAKLQADPLIVFTKAPGPDGPHQLGYEFGGTFELTVNDIKSPNPSLNSYFGEWQGDNNGGYDGWVIYDSQPWLVNPSPGPLHTGMNKVQLKTRGAFSNKTYPGGVGFWYIRLKNNP